MKKKIIFLAIIVAISSTWIVLANKFEHIVTDSYLPRLMEYQEKGIIDFDKEKFKVNKYMFKIVADDISFNITGQDPLKIDQLSACYNPFTDNVNIYTSGQKITINAGEFESYVANPKASININKSALNGDFDKVKLAFSMEKYELLSAKDNSLLYSEDSSKIAFTGDLNKTTNQYLIEINGEDKGVVIKPNYFAAAHDRIKNDSNSLPPEIKEKITKLTLSFSNYVNNILAMTESLNYKSHISMHFDKKYLEKLVKTIKREIKPNELLEDFKVTEDSVGIIVDFTGNDIFGESKILLEMSNDTKDLKGKLDISSSAYYPAEKNIEITKRTSELLSEIFNELKSESTPSLVAADFNSLGSLITSIGTTHLALAGSYTLATSDFDGDLNLAVNSYKIGLNAKGRNGKSYNSTLKLSDPAALIHTKTKFTKETLIPLLEKMVGKDNKNLVRLEKLNSNLETNGLEALMALSANPDVKAGESFEVNFSFEPDSFEFKVNGKSFLKIITDERIVKFLKGLEEAKEVKEVAPQKQEEHTAKEAAPAPEDTKAQEAINIITPFDEDNL